MTWQQYCVSDCHTHHLNVDGTPAYLERFDTVLTFHSPGLAPVTKAQQAWYIYPDGRPAHKTYFKQAFGFYCHRASVVDDSGWFHILPDGTAAYIARYAWSGNYQGNLCVVRNHNGRYFHIDLSGKKNYGGNWSYCGDFNEGVAVVQGDNGLSTHINRNGHLLHGFWFVDLDVFHKGFARAKCPDGWVHVNRQGQPIYSQRYATIEPFYNKFSRVEGFDGRLDIIDETGLFVHSLRPAMNSPFASLSADLVGYWRTLSLGTAVELGIFEVLPASLPILSNALNLDRMRLERMLWALAELGVLKVQQGEWQITDKGSYLQQSHEMSLADAALEYRGDLLQRWQALPAIIQGRTVQQDVFRQVADSESRRVGHHRMLNSYAMADYSRLIPFFDLRPDMLVLDAAGGQGTLAKLLAEYYPNVEIICADLPEVVLELSNDSIKFHAFDLFSDWRIKVDRIILARVLHDWDDKQVMEILKQARSSLKPDGQIIIIEMLRSEDSAFGALCDIHLLVATGGQERTAKHYYSLLREAGFVPSNPISGGGLVSLIQASNTGDS